MKLSKNNKIVLFVLAIGILVVLYLVYNKKENLDGTVQLSDNDAKEFMNFILPQLQNTTKFVKDSISYDDLLSNRDNFNTNISLGIKNDYKIMILNSRHIELLDCKSLNVTKIRFDRPIKFDVSNNVINLNYINDEKNINSDFIVNIKLNPNETMILSNNDELIVFDNQKNSKIVFRMDDIKLFVQNNKYVSFNYRQDSIVNQWNQYKNQKNQIGQTLPQQLSPQLSPQSASKYTTPWMCNGSINTPLRVNENGDTECMGSNGRDCDWSPQNQEECQKLLAKPPYTVNPLTCGDVHKSYYGSTGYDTPNHWCNSMKHKPIESTPAPVSAIPTPGMPAPTLGIPGPTPGMPAPTPMCKDNDNNCSDWANKGECMNNPSYMLNNCAVSCNSCNLDPNIYALITNQDRQINNLLQDNNIDLNKNCDSSQCSINPGYMKKYCKKTCNQNVQNNYKLYGNKTPAGYSIQRCENDKCAPIPGLLTQIINDKDYAYGVNGGNAIFRCKEPCIGKCELINGALKDINMNDKQIFGTGTDNNKWICDKPCLNNNWQLMNKK